MSLPKGEALDNCNGKCLLFKLGVGIAFLLLFAALLPDSNNVEFDGRTAIIHEGGTLVLVQSSGKVTNTWKISRDGDTVRMNCETICADLHPQLCGVGCTVTVHLIYKSHKVRITQLDNEDIKVEWSWPINHN